MLFFLTLVMVCAALGPFSLSYTQSNCMALALGTNTPVCYCIDSCCLTGLPYYTTAPLYKPNPNCKFMLYRNGGYECICPAVDVNKTVECSDYEYQYFDSCTF